MSRGKIADAVKSGKVLVSDGAWGTLLMEKGFVPSECPDIWCIDRADDVAFIAKSYIGAGSDMIKTCSFGGTSIKLKNYGLADRAFEINEAAARISRDAAGEFNWVLGSIGPTTKFVLTGDITEEDYYEAFKEQAIALEHGGADAVCIETMMSVDEAVQAVKAAKENTQLEVICTFTFTLTQKGENRTLMGETPAFACAAAAEAGADIVGTNCGSGIGQMVSIVEEIREVLPDIPILVHSNAGLPVQDGNGNTVYPETPEMMAEGAIKLVNAGANIVGGCCGSTPAHITAIKRALAEQFD